MAAPAIPTCLLQIGKINKRLVSRIFNGKSFLNILQVHILYAPSQLYRSGKNFVG